MRGSGTRLIEALFDRVGTRGHGDLVTEPWYSGVFSGERHLISLELEGDRASTEAQRLVSGLDDHEFVLAGCLVADLAVAETVDSGRGVRVAIEALVIDEG